MDPAVTGVLPIALGQAPRLLPYLPGEKTYRGVLQLGTITSSDDLDGEILSKAAWPLLNGSELNQALDRFRGDIEQRPPQVTAVHVNGERAHSRARRGEQMDLAARPVTIHALNLLDWDPSSGQLSIEVHCSAGTYIRALARDLGRPSVVVVTSAICAEPRPSALRSSGSSPEKDSDPPPPHRQWRWRICCRQLSTTGKQTGAVADGMIAEGSESVLLVLNHDQSLAGIGLRDSEPLRPKVVFNAIG